MLRFTIYDFRLTIPRAGSPVVIEQSSIVNRQSSILKRPKSTRRGFLKTLAGGAAALAAPRCLLPAGPKGPARPNFIIFFTDDQGYNDVGCFGSPKIRTPRFDRMAAEGMKFTSFYAQPVCGPSRAALMTGCYPIRVAEPGNKKNQHNILHPKETTIAEVLKRAGYATALVGKWHLAGGRRQEYDPALMPNAQGFDHYYGTPLHNGFTRTVSPKSFRTQIVRNGEVINQGLDQAGMDMLTQNYTREALAFVRKNKDRPFFLYLAHNMPHVPLGASKAFRGRSRRGLYGDVIEELDWSAGQVLDTLKELGIDERTLVVFTSDNGPWIEKHLGDYGGSAAPLRGWKMSAWEGGPRVPCIMRWPGKIPAGKVCREIATTMDLMPTFANLAGAKLLPGRTIDGRDIGDLITARPGAKTPHEAFYFYNYLRLNAVRSGKWKLVLPRPARPPGTGWSGRMIDAVPKTQLFDLDADVGEKRDVADENPEVVARLMKLVAKARGELGDHDRVGSGARYFDGPAPTTRSAGERRAATPKPPAEVVYTHPAPVGNLRFGFESGRLDGWAVVEGEFPHAVTDLDVPYRSGERSNKNGSWLLSTLCGTKGDLGGDKYTGVIESPVFELTGAKMSFLIGGGRGSRTRVDLCDAATGKALKTASGLGDKYMHRVNWDVGPLAGRKLVLRVVDRSTGGYGHVTFDDFSAEGKLDAEATKKRRSRGGG